MTYYRDYYIMIGEDIRRLRDGPITFTVIFFDMTFIMYCFIKCLLYKGVNKREPGNFLAKVMQNWVIFYLIFTESKSACASNPCANGGTCVDATNNDGSLLEGVIFTNHSQFKCVCPKGYAGENCQSK